MKKNSKKFVALAALALLLPGALVFAKENGDTSKKSESNRTERRENRISETRSDRDKSGTTEANITTAEQNEMITSGVVEATE